MIKVTIGRAVVFRLLQISLVSIPTPVRHANIWVFYYRRHIILTSGSVVKPNTKKEPPLQTSIKTQIICSEHLSGFPLKTKEFCGLPLTLLGSSRVMFYSYLVSMRSVECLNTDVRFLASPSLSRSTIANIIIPRFFMNYDRGRLLKATVWLNFYTEKAIVSEEVCQSGLRKVSYYAVQTI